jgi:hypothetical protein
MHEHWRTLEAEHKPERQPREHPPALRPQHTETGLMEPSTILRPSTPRPQTVRGLGGRLYHLHAGFPALDVPEGLILALGTADPIADARVQQRA